MTSFLCSFHANTIKYKRIPAGKTKVLPVQARCPRRSHLVPARRRNLRRPQRPNSPLTLHPKARPQLVQTNYPKTSLPRHRPHDDVRVVGACMFFVTRERTCETRTA